MLRWEACQHNTTAEGYPALSDRHIQSWPIQRKGRGRMGGGDGGGRRCASSAKTTNTDLVSYFSFPQPTPKVRSGKQVFGPEDGSVGVEMQFFFNQNQNSSQLFVFADSGLQITPVSLSLIEVVEAYIFGYIGLIQKYSRVIEPELINDPSNSCFPGLGL